MGVCYPKNVVIGAFAGVLLCAPLLTFAADASPQAVLRAVAGATEAGLCRETQQVIADCEKTTVRCDGGTGSGWAEYVERYFELVGGSVQAKRGEVITTTITDPFSRTPIQTRSASTETTPTEALEYLRADWQRNRATAPGPIQKGTCYCACGANDTNGACAGQPAGFPVRTGEGLTYEQCAAQCNPRTVASGKCSIQPIAPSLVGTAASTAGLDVDAWCFTPNECAEQNGFFEAYAECGSRGRCYAAEPAITLQIPIGSVTEVQGLSRYVVAAYRYGISIAAIAATVMFVYGAFLYLVGSALPSISQGRQIMLDAIIGMIFIFAATMILRTLNPAATQLDPIKVYMVNNRQFVSVAQCRDLGANVRVALAGLQPNLTPYATVAAREGSFQTLATATDCGQTYWIDGTEAASCEGSRCPSGELCISCSDPDTPGCGGIANDRKTCARMVFGGTIEYIDGRFPTRLELVGVCRDAMNASEAEAIEGDLVTLDYTFLEPERVGRRVGDTTTDADQTGRVSYRLEFTEDTLQLLTLTCANRGGVAGAVLAVVYETFAINDLAVLSPVNCGRLSFNGYADGTAKDFIGNDTDIASGLFCGIGNGNFTASSGQYWTEEALRAAAVGDPPIPCDFALTAASAPSDPAKQFCQAGFRNEILSCEDGTGCFRVGSTCQSATETCECVEEETGLFGSKVLFRNCQPR